METVLQGIVDGARLLTEARYGALLVFDDSGEVQNFLTSGITPEERRLVNHRCPEGRGLLGYLNEVVEPLRLRDFASHPASVGIPENHPPVKSLLGAPIRPLRQGFGNVYLSEKEGELEFTSEDEEIVVMFARQAAMDALESCPSETWCIGDNLLWEVEAPQALGIYSVWVDRFRVGLPAGS